MRRPAELCLLPFAVVLGFALFNWSSPSGMSPLSLLEARTVIGGGGSAGDSDCPEGQFVNMEDLPGTGCDATCVRIPNAVGDTTLGDTIPEPMSCPNRCGRFTITTATCGS